MLEERAAAVARGEAGPSKARKPGSAVQGIRGGIHRLTAALADSARGDRAELRTGTRVRSAAPTPTGWRVETDAGAFEGSSLVVALPEAQALRVLGEAGATALTLRATTGHGDIVPIDLVAEVQIRKDGALRVKLRSTGEIRREINRRIREADPRQSGSFGNIGERLEALTEALLREESLN